MIPLPCWCPLWCLHSLAVLAPYPIEFGRVPCCELQLPNDHFIGRHLVIPHVPQDLCQVTVIQLPHSSSNEGAVDVLVRSYSRPLERTNATVKQVYLLISAGLAEGKGRGTFYTRSTALITGPVKQLVQCQHTCRTDHQLLCSCMFLGRQNHTPEKIQQVFKKHQQFTLPLAAAQTPSSRGFLFDYLQIREQLQSILLFVAGNCQVTKCLEVRWQSPLHQSWQHALQDTSVGITSQKFLL